VKTSPADAAYHALTGTVPRSELRRVGLLSDGATRLVDRFGTMAWPHLLDVLDREGPYALIVQTREAENGDPEGRRWLGASDTTMRAPSYAGSDATRKNFLYNFKAGLRAAPAAAVLGQPHSYQLVDCSYIATGPLTIDDGYSTASRG
jgi:hypothetical protein